MGAIVFSRRNFLKAGYSVVGAAILSSWFSDAALSWRNGFIPSTFNGGRSQVNFDFLQTGGEFPFLNCIKTAQDWGNVSAPNINLAVDPAVLNVDGYPNSSLQPGGCYATFFVPTQAQRQGNYVVTCDGDCTIYVGNNNTLVSGSKVSSGGHVRYVFSTTDSRFLIGFASVTTTPSNFKCYHIDDEPLILAGRTFGTQFLNVNASLKFGVARFLNWQLANTTNETTWATRKSTTYWSYFASDYRPSLYAGAVTIANGLNYTCNYQAVAPTHGQIIIVKFNDTATVGARKNLTSVTVATNTFNLNAHGLSEGQPFGLFTLGAITGVFSGPTVFAKNVTTNAFQVSATAGGTVLTLGGTDSGTASFAPSATLSINNGSTIEPIVGNQGFPTTSGSNNVPTANTYVSLSYDSTFKAWIKSTNGSSSRGIGSGVPPEICLQFCREVGMHPYFVIPSLSADGGGATSQSAPLDYASNLASLVKNSGSAWMIPRFEGPNEQWNTGFNIYQISEVKGIIWWNVDTKPQMDWYGAVVSKCGQAINKSIYGNSGGPVDATKYWMLCSVQTSTGTSVSTSNPRIQSTKFVSDGGSAAYNWVTHICCANYIIPGNYATIQELKDAYNYSVSPTNALLNGYVDTLTNTVSTSSYATLPKLLTLMQNWKAWGTAQNVSVNGLTFYEGGYSPDYVTAAVTSPITGASSANPCVLTLANTTITGFNGPVSNSGNAAVIGMTLSIAGLGGTMGTLLNGNTYTVTAVSGNNVTINVDASGSSFSTNGTATYVGAPLLTNTFRRATKYAPNLQGYTYGGVSGSQSEYQNCLDAGGVNPSQFGLAQSSLGNDGIVGTAGSGEWAFYDPTIWDVPPSTAATAAQLFNN